MVIIDSNAKAVRDSLKNILNYVGDNADREGLRETPERIVKSWEKLFGGYSKDPKEVLKTFTEGVCDEMVILRNIEFYSMCEHHFLPFFGQISIGYIPDKKIIGISKLARLVEIYSRRLQIQERMTEQIADAIEEVLKPVGVMVVCKAKHLCMMMRGVERQNSEMVTSAIHGAFREKMEVREEFLKLSL